MADAAALGTDAEEKENGTADAFTAAIEGADVLEVSGAEDALFVDPKLNDGVTATAGLLAPVAIVDAAALGTDAEEKENGTADAFTAAIEGADVLEVSGAEDALFVDPKLNDGVTATAGLLAPVAIVDAAASSPEAD